MSRILIAALLLCSTSWASAPIELQAEDAVPRGVPAAIVVHNLEPRVPVALFAATGRPDETAVDYCPKGLGACLSLTGPVGMVGTGVADAAGTATFTLQTARLPAGAVQLQVLAKRDGTMVASTPHLLELTR